MRTFKGFTLIELLVVLVIIGIAASIGIPSFRTLTLDNRLAATSNSILGALQMARSEAVTQRASIRVCAANTARTACASSTNWTAGVLIMKGSTVLKVIESSHPGVTATASANEVTYRGDGTTTPSTITVSDSRGSSSNRIVRVNRIGQACSGSACS